MNIDQLTYIIRAVDAFPSRDGNDIKLKGSALLDLVEMAEQKQQELQNANQSDS